MSERLDAIVNHPLFISCYEQIQKLEEERVFCKHNMQHFLDVARIAYIMVLEDGTDIDKEIIYMTALLHDIGKHEQYYHGVPHEQTSAMLCPRILMDIGVDEATISIIRKAILNHRNKAVKNNKDLDGYLYRSDKASRPCYSCKAEADCRWSDSKKNKSIDI